MFNKKVLSLFVLSLMLISVFSFVVSAQSIIDKVFGGSGLGSTIGSSFDNVDEIGVQKVLLLLLVVLVIYSVFSFLPFFSEKKLVTFLASIVVGILSTWYLSKDEITAIIFSYTGLGITLSLVLPFFALIVISKKASENGYSYSARFLWVVYFIVNLLRYLTVDNLGTFGTLVFPLILISSLSMLVLQRYIFKSLARTALRDSIDTGIIDAQAKKSATMFRELTEWNDMPDGSPKDSYKAHLIKKWGKPALEYFKI